MLIVLGVDYEGIHNSSKQLKFQETRRQARMQNHIFLSAWPQNMLTWKLNQSPPALRHFVFITSRSAKVGVLRNKNYMCVLECALYVSLYLIHRKERECDFPAVEETSRRCRHRPPMSGAFLSPTYAFCAHNESLQCVKETFRVLDKCMGRLSTLITVASAPNEMIRGVNRACIFGGTLQTLNQTKSVRTHDTRTRREVCWENILDLDCGRW